MFTFLIFVKIKKINVSSKHTRATSAAQVRFDVAEFFSADNSAVGCSVISHFVNSDDYLTI
jgi:hypothetical protein